MSFVQEYSGGLRGVLKRPPPTAHNFLNFMQFFTKFGKIICWRPPWRVGAPSYGESQIRHLNTYTSISRRAEGFHENS